MLCCSRYGSLCLLALALMVAPGVADQPAAAKKADAVSNKPADAAKKDEAAKPVPATVTVKKGLLKITLELDGVFEAEAAHEIAVALDEWTSLVALRALPHGAAVCNALVVRRAASHGAVVRKGDVILELDPESLDQAIADVRSDLGITTLAVQQTEQQVKALEKTTPIDLEAGERAACLAEEDQKYYTDVERPFTVKATEFALRAAKESLEYNQEELRQLEKMYKADDITEETEAIVLKRARDTVDHAKFALDAAQVRYDQATKLNIPRRDVEVREATLRKLQEWEKNKVAIPLELQRQRLELERLQTQRSQTAEKLKRLEADRKEMTVKSPVDGIVYYGKIVRGKPADSIAMADALRSRGVIQPNQVVMTVVDPRPMCIRATVSEGDLHDLRPNLSGIAVPTGYPDLKLSAALDTTSDIPTSLGMFDARLIVDLKSNAKLLTPGMSCKVKLTPYRKQDAITVPPSAIVSDESDDDKQTVQVLEKDGTTKSRPVTVGRKTDKQVEIVAGLTEGEKVLIEPAKEKK